MPLSAGTRLGPFEILVPLARRDMGEVYKACDTRLNRNVAIKISHEQFSDRFDREARAIAALNHPHICTLYDIGPNYLVMEMLEVKRWPRESRRGRAAAQSDAAVRHRDSRCDRSSPPR